MNAQQLTVNECKVMWIVGSLQRLATLGLLGSDIPMKLTGDAVDIFIEIDNLRDYLFQSDFEVAQIFNTLVEIQSPDTKPEDIKPIIELLLEYKNNRTEIVKFALSHQTV